MVANICYCHIMHGIVNLMHAFLCSVCNAISYTTQDDRGSKLLRLQPISPKVRKFEGS